MTSQILGVATPHLHELLQSCLSQLLEVAIFYSDVLLANYQRRHEGSILLQRKVLKSELEDVSLMQGPQGHTSFRLIIGVNGMLLGFAYVRQGIRSQAELAAVSFLFRH